MIATADRLEGIGEYYFSQKLREIDELNRQGKQVINLGIGSPDLPPHEDVIKILQEESAKPNVHAYQSYKGSPILRRAIANWYAKWYGVSLDPDTEVLPLIGSKEGIMHICMTYINPGDPVFVPNPGYPTYRSAAKLAGGTLVEYKLSGDHGWLPDFKEIEKSITAEIRDKGALFFVNYPHMPTGQLAGKEFFEQLIAFAKANNLLLVHDNPYSFILNEEPLSIFSAEGAREVALELNSLSKSHNMAGWRVGSLCGARERIDEVLRFKSNMDSGMFLPVQLAAATALELEKNWYDSVNLVYKKRRDKVFKLLDLIGCSYSRNQVGMFVWAQIPRGYQDGFAVSDEVLYQSGVFITPGGIFGSEGNNYIRVSLCATEEKIKESIGRIKESRNK